ncbi:helix-turn-helix transcriptional regulator [Lentilactobacillus sp. IMAU92037]|uniref:helix-turn-helix transcriptional regulator n=1 Tax=Lentilactobacillus TaxID=2767893 RepID=UPI001C2670CF|nr:MULTISPECIES: helix-turn-helix transcriptional regulator [Lentilactobacillus]MBU9790259.1 helix-turn-helix transcriptional regulator [Lentilactobacillus dabitei]MBV0929888.1 helix-turn-helix transcriptional regulator [Lentilactobacillus dabitei]MDM7515729.1 helix-turn-helix transcriptional regulator [Lentilactobacillus sp. TOM.63]
MPIIFVDNNVSEHRKQLGLTQAQLAAAVGVTRRTIISLEKGKCTPSLLLALQLALKLKVNINDLFWLGGSANEKSDH